MDQTKSKMASVGKNMQDFGSVMQMPVNQVGMLNKRMEVMSTTGGRLARGIRVMTHGLRGFRMEMLGVMFFGLMLQQTFMGLLRPVMEAYGVFDLLRLLLLVLFLPVMEELFPYLQQIMDWFMELPDDVKKAIGIFVILGAILGSLLFVFGSLGLGIGSVIQAFPILGGAVKAIGGVFSGLISGVAAVAAVVVAIIIGIVLAWKENFGNIKEWFKVFWSGLVDIFSGVFDVIMGIVGIFVNLFEGDFDGLWDSVKRVFSGIWSIIKGVFKAILGLLVTVGLDVFRIVWGIWQTLKQLWQRVWEWLKSFFGDLGVKLKTWGEKMIRKLASGISNMWRSVKDAILSLFPSWARKMIWSAGKITIKLFEVVKRKVKTVFGGGGSSKRFNDFIWRPGQAPISINPNDTLIGTKGGLPSSGVNYNPTFNINVHDKREMEKMLDDNNRRMVDELRRLVKQ
jgi:hypothetical protein